MNVISKRLGALWMLLCLSLPGLLHAETKDPWEGFNRSMYVFNDTLDRYALKPVALGYQKVTPTFARDGVGRFFDNLSEPRTVLNALLQAKPGVAGKATLRFLINSTVGFLGVFDVATKLGLQPHEEDFGQTFAVWGMGSGPYLVLPFWGPSTLRDGASLIPDWFISASTYVYQEEFHRYLATGLRAVDNREGLLTAEALMFGDRYTFMRDAYLQDREFDINDGKVEDDFGDDEFEDFDF